MGFFDVLNLLIIGGRGRVGVWKVWGDEEVGEIGARGVPRGEVWWVMSGQASGMRKAVIASEMEMDWGGGDHVFVTERWSGILREKTSHLPRE